MNNNHKVVLKHFFVFLGAFLFGVQTAQAQQYVKAFATGSGTGVNWDNARGGMAGLTAAVTAAGANGTVHVAAGTYTCTVNNQLTISNTANKIYGGYSASATGTDLSSYNPAVNQTILEGANAYRIIQLSSILFDIKGFIMQNGYTAEFAPSQSVGGAAINASAISIGATNFDFKFTDMVFKNNKSRLRGGAVNLYLVGDVSTNSRYYFKNCVFTGNSRETASSTSDAHTGGGLNIEQTKGIVTIEACAFTNNSSEDGGAISVLDNGLSPHNAMDVYIVNSTFCGNTAQTRFFGTANGGAIWAERRTTFGLSSRQSVRIKNCQFSTNTAARGGAVSFEDAGFHFIDNSNFISNTATTGGAGYIVSETYFNANNFVFNTGGALVGTYNVDWTAGRVEFKDNVFYNNTLGGSTTAAGADFSGGTATNRGFIARNNKFQATSSASSNFTAYNMLFYDGNTFNNTTNPGLAAVTCPTALTLCAATGTPTLTGATVTNTCPSTIINLTSITATNLPVGTTLTWHTGTPATTANKVTTPTAVTAGIYYAAFFDATGNCYSSTSTAVTASATTCPVVAGTIDCSKTQISPAPVAGTASQLDLIVTINVTTAGCFTPLTVSGSGMSVANGVSGVCTTTTGVQTFHIPIKYDGTALGILNFTVGSAGSCSANMTQTPKDAIYQILTLDCVPTKAPSLR